jgi:hypothetical protein
MAINRLALSNASAATDTLLYTSTRNAIVSVIATNKNSSSSSNIRVWVKPSGSSTEAEYAYIAYDAVVPLLNTLETFRFPIVNGDQVYVRTSNATVSFSLNGIYESNGTSNITTGTSYPSSPAIGDIFVNTNTTAVYYWSGSAWTTSTIVGPTGPTGASTTGATGPTGPQISLSATAPQSLGTANAGVGTSASAFDHVHPNTFSTPVNSTNAANKAYVDNVTISTQVISYVVSLSDGGKLIEMNSSSANTVTIPSSGSVAFPIGASIDVLQYGSGQTTIVAAGGVTIRSSGNKTKLSGQYSAVSLYKRDTDEWVLIGDLTA